MLVFLYFGSAIKDTSGELQRALSRQVVGVQHVATTWQPGQADKMHSHPPDRVSLFDTSCILHLTNLDGSTRTAKPKAGKARLRTGEPTKGHIAKNIGDEVCIITIIEMK